MLVKDATRRGTSSLPDHLIEADGEYWTFWQTACLRGAGFPFNLVTTLASHRCAAAADEVLAMEVETESRRTEAAAKLRQELATKEDFAQRKKLTTGLKRLSKGQMPDLAPTASLDIPLWRCSAAMQKLAETRGRFAEEFSAAADELSEKIRCVAGNPMFREAVLLQNAHALQRVLRSLSHQPNRAPKRGFKERQNEELIANYLQRYCVKNDTIGFFGPVGWAHLDPDMQGVLAHPGASLVASSNIYFENWCIEALAAQIARNQAMLPWIAPRLSPYFWMDADVLHGPGGGCSRLTATQSAILKECTGEKMARDIAATVLALPGAELISEIEVYRVLEHFCSRKIISWTLEIPLDSYPERWLRARLQGIEDESLRAEAIGALNELEHAREGVALNVGNPDRLEPALEALNATFTKLTGKTSSRSAGQMYAGRTLIYEDCRRALDLNLGSDVVGSLATPLAIVLDSARWFSWEIADLYRGAFQKIHAELTAKTGKSSVDLLQFWTVSEPLLLDPKRRLANQVIPELQRRWSEVLDGVPAAGRWIKYKTDEIKAQADQIFAAPGPGWQSARYHSPDVMIAASDAEAIDRGEYFFVLGELHVTMNTLRYAFNVTQHGNAQELVDAISNDSSAPTVIPVFSRQWPRITNRTAAVLCSPQDYHLEISPQISNHPRSQVLSISKFIVESDERGLMVRTRDGDLEFDIIEFFGETLSTITGHGMEFMEASAHTPRISLDQLVICRESWRFPAAELAFIHEDDAQQRFLGFRRWKLAHAMPRFVFAKVPVEVKPFYVDFESPVYLEILAKKIRKNLTSDRAQEPVVVTEMLPAPHELWLPDDQGRRYTSELRIVARDLKGS